MIANGYGFDGYLSGGPCDLTVLVWSTGSDSSWRAAVASVSQALDASDLDAEIIVAHLTTADIASGRLAADHASKGVVRHLPPPTDDKTTPGQAVLEAATGRLLACLSDEIIVSDDWINELLLAQRRWPDAAYYVGKFELPSHEQWMAWMASQVEAMVLTPDARSSVPARRCTSDPLLVWQGVSNLAFDAEALLRCDAFGDAALGRTRTEADHLTAVLRRLADGGGYGVYAPTMTARHHTASRPHPSTWSTRVQQPISLATSWFKHLPDRLAAVAQTIYQSAPWRSPGGTSRVNNAPATIESSRTTASTSEFSAV